MQWFNLGLFLLEAVIYFTVMTTFLHFRRQLGLGVFLAALGVMHFMETYLAAVFYIELPLGTVSPGSSVFFAGKLMMILLLYLKEDAATVRQPIYGLFLGNLLTVGIAQLLQFHEVVALPGGRSADMSFLDEMGWLMVWGTALLYIDAIGIILLYERLGRFFRNHVALRFALSGAALLTFDQVGFYAALNLLFDAPFSVFLGGWWAKLLAVALYSLLFAAYLKIEQIPRFARSAREITDIFHALTFRERYQALLAQSGVDGLTGVFNRSRLDAEVPDMIRSCLDRGGQLSLVMIDVDRFKEVNDRFGHLKGDEILKDVVARLRINSRPRDHLSRFGGEEFVLILPDMDHEDALAFADRLRIEICRSVMRPDGECVTVSIGVATAPEDGHLQDALLGCADERLYRAKKDGRDNVHGRSGRLASAETGTGA
ncbi:diguanylate cyclase (GGDEF)-like protein [Rhizobium petrolearium]|uniref:GGDEF domain-containing protein n=1 Tax=Neorhizobium petrolearium TaxID=515361 RepID=UPI001AE6B8AC|nr:GGDEF domain-containing protein [Neorhizobium petrolearium]MBP1848248.1 diguanylate cyclase (GGDEF)-like protein [Neorhizobium petrolearium]